MNNVDDKLQGLGFVLTDHNDIACYWVYEKEKDDQHVEIFFDGENWFVHSESITTQRDWTGYPYHESLALRYDEMQVFMDKIEELKLEVK